MARASRGSCHVTCQIPAVSRPRGIALGVTGRQPRHVLVLVTAVSDFLWWAGEGRVREGMAPGIKKIEYMCNNDIKVMQSSGSVT